MANRTPEEMYDWLLRTCIPDYQESINKNPSDVTSMFGLNRRYRQLATLEWKLHQDVKKFKDYMKVSVDYKVERIRQIIQEDSNIATNTSSTTSMLDSISTGDEAFMKSYIELVDQYFKENRTHKDNAFYTCITHLTLDRYEELWDECVEKLVKTYSTKKWSKLMPCAFMFEAIKNRDDRLFNEQVMMFVGKYHLMTRGWFDDFEDKFLCHRGIALCNLAHMKGMKVEVDHKYIPKELIG